MKDNTIHQKMQEFVQYFWNKQEDTTLNTTYHWIELFSDNC